VAGAAGKAVKVVHVLLPGLPEGYEYRVLFMQRDLGEVLASQRAMLERLGRRGAELTEARLAEVFVEHVGGGLDEGMMAAAVDPGMRRQRREGIADS
jgi:hypothetical protein